MSDHPSLIFDLGAHTGQDSDFFLNKGFKVVGVEANPKLSRGLSNRFSNFIQSNDFILHDCAIVENQLEKVSIFINEDKDDWSSLLKNVASKGTYAVTEVEVSTITLKQLFDLYGIPYYLKVDLELYDVNIARALRQLNERPSFVSFEIHDRSIINILQECGYNRF